MKKMMQRENKGFVSIVALFMVVLLSFWVMGCSSDDDGDGGGESTTGTVKGIVTDSVGGTTLEGVTVTVGGISVDTSADGHYIISGVTGGSYTITAKKTGYGEYSGSVTIIDDQAVFDNIVMSPQTNSGTVKGIVTDSVSGKALEGTTIMIDSVNSISDAQGHYQFTGVSAGSKTIVASKSGYTTYSATISVSAGQTTFQDIAMTVHPTSGNVRGIVTESGSEKVLEGVFISIGSISVTSGSDGSYQLTGVSAGTQTINATKSGYDSYSTGITVTAGETTAQNIEMSVKSSVGTVSGTVSDQSTGSVIESAIVSIGTAKTQTDSLGNYRLTGISSGNQVITAQKSGYSDYSGNVNVVANQTTDYDITMSPQATTGAVSGTVTDSGTTDKLEGVKVVIGAATTQTDSNGQYQLSGISAGSQTITAQKSGYNNYSDTVTVIAGQTVTKNISMTPADTHGIVYGTVKDEDTGNPIGGAGVWIGNTYTTTASDGSYQLTGILQGTQEVFCYEYGYLSFPTKVDVVGGAKVQHDIGLIPNPLP